MLTNYLEKTAFALISIPQTSATATFFFGRYAGNSLQGAGRRGAYVGTDTNVHRHTSAYAHTDMGTCTHIPTTIYLDVLDDVSVDAPVSPHVPNIHNVS
jgi:hypothetical protein